MSDSVCQRIRVRGVVQGVGFRPFVWRLARELSLTGWVRNDGDGVEIEAHGGAAALAALRERICREAPPRARIDELTARDGAGPRPAAGFAIIESAAAGGALTTAIGPDTGVCDACLAEICTPGNRRYRYAFATCTHCGPRYTIARNLPYDRALTSLAPFPLCPDCAGEYADPADRRFHAEATCCPACGPQLQLRDAGGAVVAGDPLVVDDPLVVGDPLAATVARLRAGQLVAIKGLGGFHLACDARDAGAVARLRARKHRDEKPFALMVANAACAATWCAIDGDEAALLRAPERPVVLLAKRDGVDLQLPDVAPGLDRLGVMLPYTPLHVLLFHEAAGRPAGSAWLQAAPGDATVGDPSTAGAPLTLVMTSANPGGEPLVIDNDEAFVRLAGIADAFLVHDRAIVARADDSVVRAVSGGLQFLRRGRGFTPQAIRLPRRGPPVIAFGGWFKNAVCVTRENEAFLSAHVGDLDNAPTCGYLDETVDRLLDLLAVSPAIVARDRHPDLHASRAAAAFAAARGLPCVAVQHHHAHIAAVCAEHGVDGPVLGLALDGVGLGDDGGVWGGELLEVDGAAMRRLGHLRELPLPGGDRAAREPWRMGAAALHVLGRGDEIAARFAAQPGAPTVAQMLARGVNSPLSSSAGRCFDAAAGLLGIKPAMAYEGQAAMLLEGLAAAHLRAHGPVSPVAGGWRLDAGVLDLRPLLAHLADASGEMLRACPETDAAGAAPGAAAESMRAQCRRLAAQFHATLAAALAAWVIDAARARRLTTVVAGGGCLLNHVLAQALRAHLTAAGLRLLEARRAPPNDGGLALGQAWVALQSEI